MLQINPYVVAITGWPSIIGESVLREGRFVEINFRAVRGGWPRRGLPSFIECKAIFFSLLQADTGRMAVTNWHVSCTPPMRDWDFGGMV